MRVIQLANGRKLRKIGLTYELPSTAGMAEFLSMFVLARQFLQGRKGQWSISPKIPSIRRAAWHGFGTDLAQVGHGMGTANLCALAVTIALQSTFIRVSA